MAPALFPLPCCSLSPTPPPPTSAAFFFFFPFALMGLLLMLEGCKGDGGGGCDFTKVEAGGIPPKEEGDDRNIAAHGTTATANTATTTATPAHRHQRRCGAFSKDDDGDGDGDGESTGSGGDGGAFEVTNFPPQTFLSSSAPALSAFLETRTSRAMAFRSPSDNTPPPPPPCPLSSLAAATPPLPVLAVEAIVSTGGSSRFIFPSASRASWGLSSD
mmetsp:Transcript_84470/g.164000  ORF Transcript_84470/g.164000 Transcript_84470/m.164000 type:complete len:216 (-) Transcript_84470:265-912(-)